MLAIDRLNLSYGQVQVINDVSLAVRKEGITCVLGSNGAGKTTLLNAIAGLHKPSSGSVTFDNRRTDGMPPEEIAKLGVIFVPMERAIFSTLTVEENLEVAAGSPRSEEMRRCYSMFPILKDREKQIAGTLSGGEQKMLAISIGLVRRPKLLIVDEPSSGLSPILAEKLHDALREIRKQGCTLLMAEQSVRLLHDVESIYVLENGVVVASGDLTILDTPEVRKAYLGM